MSRQPGFKGASRVGKSLGTLQDLTENGNGMLEFNPFVEDYGELQRISDEYDLCEVHS